MTMDVPAKVSSLTLENKVALLAGHDLWHTEELPGVPVMRSSDGPAGVRGTSWVGPASASFPCGTALGATFDPALIEEVGEALAREARSKGVDVLLAPTVNLHRTPIGGRNFECISEDPVLTSRIAVGYVRGVQRHHVACCIKHFVANDTEFERQTISSELDEVTLRELYLVPFEAAVQTVGRGGANVRSVMSSYNRINGTYASEHKQLLRGVLRDEWGFDGVVISDWYGTHSAAASLEAGLDLEMPGPPRHRGEALLAAVLAGETTEARIDESVRRLLELIGWTGAGHGDRTEATDDSPATRAVIRRAAVAGTVLLRNEGGALPLAPGLKIALLGPNAARGQVQGGGSARVRPNRSSHPLAALQGRDATVVHEAGCRIDKRLPPMRGDFAVLYRGANGETTAATTDQLQFVWMERPAPNIDQSAFGVSITGSFTPDVSGDWAVGLTAVGTASLCIDGAVVLDLAVPQTGGSFFGLGSEEMVAVVPCQAGVPRQVQVEIAFADRAQLRGLLVSAQAPAIDNAIERAVSAAGTADVAVVVVGTNADWETEGEDRATLALPGEQDELISRVAAVNRRTIVVINAGSPVAMPWLDEVAAVMQVWFPGEEFGEALADMLFGVAEPSGRLPITIPRRLEDTPAFAHHPGRDGKAEYREGLLIGHRWYDAHCIAPEFAFGYGLGYTEWTMGEATVTGEIGSGVVVQVPVRNVGRRAGSTVVQCYVEPVSREPGRPLRTLQGFAKVHAPAGREAIAEVVLDERAFSRWDVSAQRWVVPDGDYRIMVGWSSAELTQASVSRAPVAG
ncbi:MAG: glycoside hydrolase family 3 C-terminal domain-containing protein [Actinobacteria bacterium]|nr:glycoside hydrolase family 3 C-terminal domain-containing protein [Actinomycetota bacterium]